MTFAMFSAPGIPGRASVAVTDRPGGHMMHDPALRRSRFLDALGGVIDLLDSQVPGLSVPSERLSAILGLLHREAAGIMEEIEEGEEQSPVESPRVTGLRLVRETPLD